MFVRQLIGRQANQIVDMPYADAMANLNAGTAARVTDDEVREAGHQAEAANLEVPPEQLLSGYRIEPAIEGGFDLYDPGGVKVSEKPFHNHIEARAGAIAYARKARGLPDLFDPTGQGGKSSSAGGDTEVDYEDMKVDDLKALADKRGVAATGNKAAIIKALERDDTVRQAIAARDFEVLHVDELRAHAEKEQIDLTGKTSKQDIVEAFNERYKAKA
jgi:hypothetical protein